MQRPRRISHVGAPAAVDMEYGLGCGISGNIDQRPSKPQCKSNNFCLSWLSRESVTVVSCRGSIRTVPILHRELVDLERQVEISSSTERMRIYGFAATWTNLRRCLGIPACPG